MGIVNCHTHTFTHDHTPDRFVPRPFNWLLRIGWLRHAVLAAVEWFDPEHQTRVARYAEILATSDGRDQAAIFAKLRGFYPSGTRFVILPIDMTFMGLGDLRLSIDQQHDELLELAAAEDGAVIPFAAVDARHPDIVETTIERLENGFKGIKLYPPIGCHPFDSRLWPLYEWAEQQSVPVLSHCSRPASVQFHGTPTAQMQTDPVTGQVGNRSRIELLTWFTDPDSYKPLLLKYPALRVCLAHFGGAGDWDAYLNKPWSSDNPAAESWLSKIVDMIRSGDHPNLWTDIAYTLYADDDYVYLLKVLLSDERILSRTLFGSDFYVVENARLEERRRSVRIRAVLGEELFSRIAVTNPTAFLQP